MNVQELKNLADENGVDYKPNYSAKKMQEVLEEAGIEVKVKVPNNAFREEIRQMAQEFNHVTTKGELNRAKTKLDQLRRKVKESGDENALYTLLKWERQRKLIGIADTYALNAIENDMIDDEFTAECINPLPSPGIQAKVGENYKFTVYFDENYQHKITKTQGVNIYTFYIPVVISGDAQIDRKLEQKMNRGFLPQEGDYAPDIEGRVEELQQGGQMDDDTLDF